ncbi:Fic/DOC family protein [Anatilimnocola aggregata]|uniref:Fic/DOC family protein n=2 Tax=Anatilimnocola aggregata TaxID=2528021 RepID=A0A517Y4E8_9BACT|nr:Fic/DOC family protein [Anatilimnocola aggregata]
MAAAYLFHLVQNHPFLDGNKRVGAATATVFLRLNGMMLTASEDEFAEHVQGVASGAIGKPQVTEFIRRNTADLDD